MFLPGCGMMAFQIHSRHYAGHNAPAWGALREGTIIESIHDIPHRVDNLTDGSHRGGRIYYPYAVPKPKSESQIYRGEQFRVVSLSEKKSYATNHTNLTLIDKNGSKLIISRGGGLDTGNLYSEQRLREIGFRIVRGKQPR